MGNCNQSTTMQNGLMPECEPTFIGCVPVTNGLPTVTPAVDQLPIHVDPATGCVWLYVCDNVGWYSVCPGSSLCDLDPVDTDVLTDVCEQLNIPVVYTVEGTCVEGVITLQNLADEILTCLGETAGDCCFEPYTEVGRSGTFTRSRCFRIDDTTNQGVRLLDTLTSDFEGSAGGVPMDWSYTNTTNQPGLLTIHASMWAERFQPTSSIPARVLFLLGREDRVKFYPLNTPSAAGTQASTPHIDDNVSYDTRVFIDDPIYPFWGNWVSTLCPLCDPSMGADADVSHEFLLDPDETIDLSARIAIGYAVAVDTANAQLESGWVGVNIRYTFQGANDVSTT